MLKLVLVLCVVSATWAAEEAAAGAAEGAAVEEKAATEEAVIETEEEACKCFQYRFDANFLFIELWALTNYHVL